MCRVEGSEDVVNCSLRAGRSLVVSSSDRAAASAARKDAVVGSLLRSSLISEIRIFGGHCDLAKNL
jgi:hypothetical protein